MAQYDRLRKRNAFLEQYKKEFSNDLGEFDEARSVVADLVAEYESAETPNYLTFTGGKHHSAE